MGYCMEEHMYPYPGLYAITGVTRDYNSENAVILKALKDPRVKHCVSVSVTL